MNVRATRTPAPERATRARRAPGRRRDRSCTFVPDGRTRCPIRLAAAHAARPALRARRRPAASAAGGRPARHRAGGHRRRQPSPRRRARRRAAGVDDLLLHLARRHARPGAGALRARRDRGAGPDARQRVGRALGQGGRARLRPAARRPRRNPARRGPVARARAVRAVPGGGPASRAAPDRAGVERGLVGGPGHRPALPRTPVDHRRRPDGARPARRPAARGAGPGRRRLHRGRAAARARAVAGHRMSAADDAITVREGTLWVEGRAADELAREFGTPLYVISEAQLRGNARRWSRALSAAWSPGPTQLLPSLKANTSVVLRRVLNDEGLGCDVFGHNELALALRAGVPAADISVNGATKDDAVLDLAIASGARVTLDSLDELRRAAAVGQARGAVARVRLRLRPWLDASAAPSDYAAEDYPAYLAVHDYRA